MFTEAEREQLRDVLLDWARVDERIEGAAITGSGAQGGEDRWSDIDLAFGLAAEVDPAVVIADWTARMYRHHSVVDHVDVARGATVYRVFLLASTLQVDLAFSPGRDFGAIAPSFRLLFGTAQEQPPEPTPSAKQLIGLGWLHALHARSSIARRRMWQAEYMISGVRDHALVLACRRHGVSISHGRGIDSLPPADLEMMEEALVRSLERSELQRAFRVACEVLIAEIDRVDANLRARLVQPLRELLM